MPILPIPITAIAISVFGSLFHLPLYHNTSRTLASTNTNSQTRISTLIREKLLLYLEMFPLHPTPIRYYPMVRLLQKEAKDAPTKRYQCRRKTRHRFRLHPILSRHQRRNSKWKLPNNNSGNKNHPFSNVGNFGREWAFSLPLALPFSFFCAKRVYLVVVIAEKVATILAVKRQERSPQLVTRHPT